MRRITLDQDWEFEKLAREGTDHNDEDGVGVPVETVCLPHTWYDDEEQYRGIGIYRRRIELNRLLSDEEIGSACLFLEVNGADNQLSASVNGAEIGSHEGGYSCIHMEIPSECVKIGVLDMELRVSNEASGHISPLSGDFTIFGGLYRGVNLLVSGSTHFDYLYHGTDGVIAQPALREDGVGVLEIQPHVSFAPEADRERFSVVYTLRDGSGNIAAETEGTVDGCTQMTIPGVSVWEGMEHPRLYTLCATLREGAVCHDEVVLTTGFRRIHMDAQQGFFLNGRRLKINGIAKHQDFAGCFSAVTDTEIDRDFELIREIGANAIRLSHYQHPKYTYDLCDRNGYIVWAEIPMLKMKDDEKTVENAVIQLRELILQNIHRPSICFWGLQNEIGMFRDAPYVHRQMEKIKNEAQSLDPDRILTAANLYPMKSKSKLNQMTEMIGYNIYFGWYYGEMTDYGAFLDRLHGELPHTALGVSEYGVDAQTWLHSDDPKVKDYSEEFQALFHETVYPILESRDYLWGSFVWNMFDFSSSRRNEGGVRFMNAKGLVSYDREVRKDAFYYYKAKWSKEPTLHICAKRFRKRCTDTMTLKIYTNLPEVEITGTAYAEPVRLRVRENRMVCLPDVPLQHGENRICVCGKTGAGTIEAGTAGAGTVEAGMIGTGTVVHAGESEHQIMDEAIFIRTEEPDLSYVLPDSGAGQTVQNWFLNEADIDEDQYFSIKDRAEELIEHKECLRVLRTYIPEVTVLLEREVIPLGLALSSILNYNKEGPDKETLRQMNEALRKIAK